MTYLKELRKSKGISQFQLAKLCNISLQSISGYETGYAQPTLTTLIKLADVLETTTDELLGRTDFGTGLVNISNQLSKFENNLLTVVNKLSKEDQYQVLGFAQALAN